ncbi:MAG: hypothetical protein WCZ72_04755 [Gemmobacter sp.]
MKTLASTFAAIALSASVAGAADIGHVADSNIAVTRNVPAELLLLPVDRVGLDSDTVQVTVGHTALVPAGELLSAADLEVSGLAADTLLPVTTFAGAEVADVPLHPTR